MIQGCRHSQKQESKVKIKPKQRQVEQGVCTRQQEGEQYQIIQFNIWRNGYKGGKHTHIHQQTFAKGDLQSWFIKKSDN